jgi:acyl-CoA thioesterase
MSQFSDTIAALSATDDGAWTANPDESWRQGRTLFGGLSAALCYAACERAVPALPPLRSAQIAFIGPSAGAATLRPAVLRRGKSVTFMDCDLVADGAVATRALFCFGGERESAFGDDAPAPPVAPHPDDCGPLWGERRPSFTQHLDQRLAGGHRPVSGATQGEMLVWVRLVDATPTSSLAALVALGDALPPAAMPRLTGSAAISTMTWQFDLIDPEQVDPSGWFLLRSSVETMGHGYSLQKMAMWDEAGAPVLIGRQNVAIFA